jgi:hypothetical protein
LRVIDVLVRDFLRGVKARGRRGVVVNLGCGRLVAFPLERFYESFLWVVLM